MDWLWVAIFFFFVSLNGKTAIQHAIAIRFHIVCPCEWNSFIRSALCCFGLKLLVLQMMPHISFRWPYFFLFAHCCSSFECVHWRIALPTFYHTRCSFVVCGPIFHRIIIRAKLSRTRYLHFCAVHGTWNTFTRVRQTKIKKRKNKKNETERSRGDIFNECEFLQIKLLFESMEF